MTILLGALFVSVALAAAAFAALPLLAKAKSGRAYLIAGLVAAFVVAAGLGTYYLVGAPSLALRTLAGADENDFRGLIATLAQSMREPEHANDPKGWTLLGRSYLQLGDADDAAKALGRAIALERTSGAVSPALYSSYGEALSEAAGDITPDAAAAFHAALAANPKDPAARYYLGLAAATRGQTEEALKYWEGLLADAPANASWRDALIDQVATLRAQAVGQGAPAPDIDAMVQELAARLGKNPENLDGWLRLIRAYAVLGEDGKAKQALAQARASFAQKHAQTALASLAKQLKLEN